MQANRMDYFLKPLEYLFPLKVLLLQIFVSLYDQNKHNNQVCVDIRKVV